MDVAQRRLRVGWIQWKRGQDMFSSQMNNDHKSGLSLLALLGMGVFA